MKITIRPVTRDVGKMFDADYKRIATVATATMREGARIIKEKGRAEIAAGGFSKRWQNALRVKNYPERGISASPAISVFHKIKYAGQFEDPQPVIGQPLIWLPITKNLPLQARGKRWTPADFVRTVGPLRGGRRGSKPLLFGQVAVGRAGGVLALPPGGQSRTALRRRARFSQAKKQWMPVFVGVPAVKDPKRFNIRGVVERVGNGIISIYSDLWSKSDG